MKKFLRRILHKPVLWLSEKFSSKPEKKRIFSALTDLFNCIIEERKEKGLVIPFDLNAGKFIIFSDQHKGSRNGADDFTLSEKNYLNALDYYNQSGFTLIALGDCEELWENTLTAVKKEHKASFEKEKKFIPRNAFIKIFGNHDLFWKNDPFAAFQLKDIYEYEVPIYEGVVLQTTINKREINLFCTHGHQGDKVSDGNWFSKFFVSKIWGPLQSFLLINPNTPAYDKQLKTLHNHLMYQWSVQQPDLILITGHTHQPVFESLTHIERLYRQLLFARQVKDDSMTETLQKEIQLRKFQTTTISDEYLHMRPCYYNTGCCCYNDGDITGIEISEGTLRLIEWSTVDGECKRYILEEAPLAELIEFITKK